MIWLILYYKISHQGPNDDMCRLEQKQIWQWQMIRNWQLDNNKELVQLSPEICFYLYLELAHPVNTDILRSCLDMCRIGGMLCILVFLTLCMENSKGMLWEQIVEVQGETPGSVGGIISRNYILEGDSGFWGKMIKSGQRNKRMKFKIINLFIFETRSKINDSWKAIPTRKQNPANRFSSKIAILSSLGAKNGFQRHPKVDFQKNLETLYNGLRWLIIEFWEV